MDSPGRNYSASAADLLASFHSRVRPALRNAQWKTTAGKLSEHRTAAIRDLSRKSYAMQAQNAGTRGKKSPAQPLDYSPSVRKSKLQAASTASHTSSNPLRFRTVPLMLAGITLCAISGYSAYLYVGYKRAVASGASENVPADVSYRYDAIASSFDSSVNYQESLMGLTKLRKRLAQEAYGDVCEVSIGTGRNITFYDWDFRGVNGVGKIGAGNKIKRGKVKSFTAIDKSAEMLEIAHEKFSKEYPGILGIRWVLQDASQPLPSPPLSANERSGNKSGKKYDTIVQTMGLCSTADPVGLLKNLGNSVERDGRILLLEHGRGTWGWVNDILDSLAPHHASEFGCWWNKDIGQIVKDSELEVVRIERKHLGTTWWIELKPKPAAADEEPISLPEKSPSLTPSPPKSSKNSWWPF